MQEKGHEGVGSIVPPAVDAIPHERVIHNRRWNDNYDWIRTESKDKVLKHLERENEYTARSMEHTESLQKKLYAEVKGYIKEPDESVPVRIDQYFYYVKHERDAQYSVTYRKKIESNGRLGKEQVVFDSNKEAKSSKFFDLADVKVSPDHTKVAYAINSSGSEIYTIRIRDLTTGEDLPDVLENASGTVVWSADSRQIIYGIKSDRRASYGLMRHELGKSPHSDSLLFHSDDNQFGVSAYSTRSKRFIIFEMGDFDSEEMHFVPADRPDAHPVLFAKRETGHRYFVDHHDNYFYILTNKDAKDFRIVRAPISSPGIENWQTIISHVPGQTITELQMYQDFMTIVRRVNGVPRLFVYRHDGSLVREIPTHAGDGDATLDANPMFDQTVVRFSYSSPTSPLRVSEHDVMNNRTDVLKTQEIPSGYDASKFESTRVFARSRDG